MQNTLLSLGIACILALLAALVGPYFVNWNNHRAFFEAEASRLIGLQVRVSGPIQVGVLPFPSVTLGNIEIGPAGEAARLRAASLSVELGLGPLLRGEIRATQMQLATPEINVGLNSLGQVDWPAMQIASNTLSIDRLKITDGRVVLNDALSSTRRILQQVSFDGDVRSLAGPVRGRGGFVTNGQLYGYTIAAGRYENDGLRIKLSIEDADRPLNIDVEGMLAFERGSPRFDGNVALVRPVSAVPNAGKTIINEPWRLASKVKASAEAAVLEQVTFQYGAEERSARLAGDAKLTFGEKPRLEGALSARQIDIDRLIATSEAPRRLPLAAFQTFAEMFGGALGRGLPVKLALSIDAMTIGGATLQAVGCDLRSDGTTWQLDKLEFRAPGFTQVRLSGRLDPSVKGIGYSGDTSIEANDPKTLVAWLVGQPAATAQIKPWQLRGVMTLGQDRIAVERLRTEFERGTIEGRLDYVWSAGDRPARLVAELKAGELDVDALMNFAESAFSGAGLERPKEVSLAIEIGKAKIAGFEARQAAARLKFDATGIAIEKFSVADFGNAKVDAIGRIETSASPGGTITFDLDARELNGVIALADKFAAPLADTLRQLSARRKTAKLRATVSLENTSADSATGRLVLGGTIGTVKVDVKADAVGKPDAFVVTDLRALAATEVRFDGTLESEDGGVLLALVGLDRVTGDNRPGRLTLKANGPLNNELKIEGKLAAGPIDAVASGIFRREADKPSELRLEQVTGSIGASKAQGRLVLTFGASTKVDGALEVDTLDAPAVIAAAIGMPASRAKPGDAAAWSPEPFAVSTSNLVGRIELKAQRATLTPALTAQKLRGQLRIGPSEVVFDEVAADLGKGKLDGRLSFVLSRDGISARARVALSGADASAVLAPDGRSPVAGRLAFKAEVEGAGLSPAAFIGSLIGNGTLTLENTQLTGLNPHIFDAVVRAVDIGVPTEANRIRDFVTTALDNASFAAARIEVPISINVGHARVSNVSLRAGAGTDLEATANLDLADLSLDAVLTLMGAPAAQGAPRPSIQVTLRGPFGASKRVVDTSALTGWLAMRAIEQQSKRIDTMEQMRREAIAQPTTPEEARQEPARQEPAATETVAPPISPEPSTTPAPAQTVTTTAPATEPAVTTTTPAAAPSTTNSVPAAANQAPPLPPAITVMPAPRPRPVPRTEAAQTRPAAPPPKPAAPVGRPLDLLGSQY